MTRYRPDLGAPPEAPGVVPELLQEYGAATRLAMEDYLVPGAAADTTPSTLHALLADYPRRGGKMLRPSICIAHARAFGATLQEAVLTAAAIELLHNAFLIHDDIVDGSEERRERPTLHALHGVPLALHAGDTLMLLALRPLMDNVGCLGERLALAILRETELMARETAEGQALELEWRDGNRVDVTEADYLTMVLKKTAWISTIFPARAGALIGSGGAVDPWAFVRFGFFLGAAFQIQDDLLNLRAGGTRYGKERCGDLYEAKRTLILVHARQACSATDRDSLDGLLTLSREERTAEHVAWMRDLIERHGSLGYAATVAQALSGAALHEYALAYGALPESRDKAFIGGLATWVFERSH